jgi:hypothetical protein
MRVERARDLFFIVFPREITNIKASILKKFSRAGFFSTPADRSSANRCETVVDDSL